MIVFAEEIEIKVKGYRCNNCGYEWLASLSKRETTNFS